MTQAIQTANEIWVQIQEKVLNNIKFHILKSYPAEILHSFNGKIDSIVKQYIRYLPPHVALNEIYDLKTIAQLEFIEALKVWNPSQSSDIWPLAYAKINGAMKDHIRYLTKSDPSSLYDWVTDAAHFYLNLNENNKNSEDTLEPSFQLQEILEVLAEREKKIVIEHIYHDLTFKEISKKVNVSESQISRIYKKALEKIRKEIIKSSE